MEKYLKSSEERLDFTDAINANEMPQDGQQVELPSHPAQPLLAMDIEANISSDETYLIGNSVNIEHKLLLTSLNALNSASLYWFLTCRRGCPVKSRESADESDTIMTIFFALHIVVCVSFPIYWHCVKHDRSERYELCVLTVVQNGHILVSIAAVALIIFCFYGYWPMYTAFLLCFVAVEIGTSVLSLPTFQYLSSEGLVVFLSICKTSLACMTVFDIRTFHHLESSAPWSSVIVIGLSGMFTCTGQVYLSREVVGLKVIIMLAASVFTYYLVFYRACE